MSGAVLKSNTISRVLLQKNSITHLTDPLKAPFPGNQTQPRTYFRLPDFLKKTKEYEFPHSLISSSFSSSSPSTTSVSKIGFVGWYLGMVKSRPVFTKSVTSALIYTAADLSSQTIAQSSSEPYDFVRTLRMAGYGMIILGPTLHLWFNFVSKLFPRRDIFSTLKKMVMGQAIYGPAMTVVFFSYNACMQGETNKEIVARLKRDLLPTMLNGVMYWPVCDFITFRFIPVHLQPLVSNSFSYLWTIYMTYMASLEKASAAPS
ncbi:PXMP2/4 family protein 4 [Quillaja saponaria]|uniref:PXMP2/4 family protein 4 n=1 Tax=Quillaja saponaria TaxID=32244 RepID=A0AAD7M0A5_QUISA|nr:PXMP2/4 family protein 4 [Quillaja saponaria]